MLWRVWRPSPEPKPQLVRPGRLALGLELALLLGFFLFYLTSFELSSSVNGPYEVFGQDSKYILKYLDNGRVYGWNPQSHLLYHVVVDEGYRAWSLVFPEGIESVYRYLKLLTALCGLGFLAAMLKLFRELGLRPGPRLILLLLSGVSMSAWFHFAAFETHCLAMPALALYLLALVRLRDRSARSVADRALLIGSLLICGWTRVDLFRFAAVSGALVLLPRLRLLRRSLVVDLTVVAVLGVIGTAGLAAFYLGESPADAATVALKRNEGGVLKDRLWHPANLAPRPLWHVARAVTIYSELMPVEARAVGRSFLAPPTYHVDQAYSGSGTYLSAGLFLEPARRMLDNALSAVAFVGLLIAFLWAAWRTASRVVAGDSLHTMLVVQAAAGWLLYSLFNPFEPFLWIAEFMPLWILALADHSRGRRSRHWAALAVLAGLVLAHNLCAFYVPFR